MNTDEFQEDELTADEVIHTNEENVEENTEINPEETDEVNVEQEVTQDNEIEEIEEQQTTDIIEEQTEIFEKTENNQLEDTLNDQEEEEIQEVSQEPLEVTENNQEANQDTVKTEIDQEIKEDHEDDVTEEIDTKDENAEDTKMETEENQNIDNVIEEDNSQMNAESAQVELEKEEETQSINEETEEKKIEYEIENQDMNEGIVKSEIEVEFTEDMKEDNTEKEEILEDKETKENEDEAEKKLNQEEIFEDDELKNEENKYEVTNDEKPVEDVDKSEKFENGEPEEDVPKDVEETEKVEKEEPEEDVHKDVEETEKVEKGEPEENVTKDVEETEKVEKEEPKEIVEDKEAKEEIKVDILPKKEGQTEDEKSSENIEDNKVEKVQEDNEVKIPPEWDGVSNFMTVHIQKEDGTVKNQVITIEKSKLVKPFIGGYRHKQNGLEYHNASIQTVPKPRPPPSVELFSRDCQTFQIKHKRVNTENTTSTQMTGPYYYVSNVTDKLLTPSKYESAEEYEQKMLNNIILIQKYYRRWLAKNTVEERRKQRDSRLKWEEDMKLKKSQEKEDRLRYENLRRMHPKTKADFDLLYNDLERWRREELQKIEEMDISEAEKKAWKSVLLDRETDLLARIDRHKIDLQKDGQAKSMHKLLNKAAAPKTWKTQKGKKIELDTPYIIRSRELLEILNSLNMHYLTVDERLDVLLTLKHTVKEHECKLTRDIVELVDREADLIMRNVKEDCLVGLRKRIVTLFLQYCKTPNFNPEISLLLKVPQDSSTLIGDVNYCQYCARYLRSIEFSLSSKSKKLTICKACARKDNQSRSRQDYSHYRRILKDLQDEEIEYNDESRMVFIFKQNDIKSLLESVWDSKSILSGIENLDELAFVRWDVNEHWSPWNTILLDKDEAEAHKKIKNLSEMYSSTLINRIYQKHVIGRNNFASLERMLNQVIRTKSAPKLPEITSQ